jgi:hypothetical protein
MMATDIVVNIGHYIGFFFWCADDEVPVQSSGELQGAKIWSTEKKQDFKVMSVSS